jgi:hypothetical protein
MTQNSGPNIEASSRLKLSSSIPRNVPASAGFFIPKP